MNRPGDEEVIDDWKSKYTIDQLKQMTIEKGFTALSVGSQGHAVMKKFDYHLTNEIKPNGNTNKTYILHRKKPEQNKATSEQEQGVKVDSESDPSIEESHGSNEGLLDASRKKDEEAKANT